MTPSAPLPPQTIDGKYEILRQLGEGGMGAVYEARHRGTGRRVAVKVIGGEALAHGAEPIVRRFQREAMATGAIDSQYIAHAIDAGTDPASGAPYLVMDLLVGEDLQQTLQRLGPLPPEVALRIAAQACLGLQKAHEAGVVHRDIKPGNLFLARRERGEVVVKILDFGIAKVKMDQFAVSQSVDATRTGSLLGSPLYMSPEQARGKKSVDHRTDIWSLGVVLYETLSGRTPYGRADTIGELIFQICAEELRPLQECAPWVPQGAADIVQRALARDPEHRFGSAGEMFDALHALLPRGEDLDTTALSPLSPELRDSVAIPALPLAGAPTMATPLASGQRTELDPVSPVRVSTTAGFAGGSRESKSPSGSRARKGIASVLAACALAGVGVGVSLFAHRDRGEPSPATTTPSRELEGTSVSGASPAAPSTPTGAPAPAPSVTQASSPGKAAPGAVTVAPAMDAGAAEPVRSLATAASTPKPAVATPAVASPRPLKPPPRTTATDVGAPAPAKTAAPSDDDLYKP